MNINIRADEEQNEKGDLKWGLNARFAVEEKSIKKIMNLQ